MFHIETILEQQWGKSSVQIAPTTTSASLTMLKPLTIWITTNWKIQKKMEVPDHLTWSPEKLECRQRSNSWNWTWNNRLVQNWERSTSRLYFVTLLTQLLHRVHHVKCWAGRLKSWNQHSQKKYHLPQICI